MSRRQHRDMDASAFAGSGMEIEENDPMSGLSNLADAMLVFACGLMMALVVRYDVNLKSVQDVEIAEDLSEVENIDELTEDIESGGSGYTELGKVYQDPSTGKMYMVTESAQGASAEAEISSTGTGE